MRKTLQVSQEIHQIIRKREAYQNSPQALESLKGEAEVLKRYATTTPVRRMSIARYRLENILEELLNKGSYELTDYKESLGNFLHEVGMLEKSWGVRVKINTTRKAKTATIKISL